MTSVVPPPARGELLAACADGLTVFLDAGRLPERLQIRRWRDGDRIRPLGMTGSKKVKELLTDRKVPPSDRAGVCVITADDDPVWVVGYDIDRRYRLRDTTRSALRMDFLVF